jgi:hypothetical protein
VLLRQAGDRSAAAAEDCFNQARETAREQGTSFWELRVASALPGFARSGPFRRRDSGSPAGLRPLYRITEGFDTTDLKAVKSLLDALQ